MLLLATCIETSLFAQNYDGTVVAPSGQTLYYLWDTYEQKAIITHPNWGDWSGYTMPAGNLIIPDSITHNGVTLCVSEIAGSAFINCIGLTSVTIPDEVDVIGSSAFNGCTSLTSVTIGRGVNNIESYAFGNCTNLATVTFNADSCACSFLNWSIFSGCSNISTFSFGNNVRRIPRELCKNLTGLTTVIVPDSVEFIGWRAFDGCTNLTTITLGSGIKTIEDYAFSGCPLTRTNYTGTIESWTRINVHINFNPSAISHNLYLNDTLLTHLVVPSSVDTIKNFRRNTGLSTVTISNGVKAIGDNAFDGCNQLLSASIPNSVSYIGNYAFNDVNYMTFNIPDSVVYIGESAFYGSHTIDSIVIPSTVTHIGEWAFHGNLIYNLKIKCPLEVIVPKLSSLFVLTNYVYGDAPCSQIFLYGSSIVDWIQKVTVRDEWGGHIYDLYINDTMVTNVTLPDTVTSIKDYAFSGIRSLQSINIPNSVTSIGISAFENCQNLQHVYLSDSIQNIRDRTFNACRIRNIVIPGNISLIANNAFSDVDTLTILRATPPTLYDAARYEDIHQIQEASANFGCSKIAVPCNAITTYENSSTWGGFNIIGAKEAQPHVYDTVVTSDCYYVWNGKLLRESNDNITYWSGVCNEPVYSLNLTVTPQHSYTYDTIYLCQSIGTYLYLGPDIQEFHDSLAYNYGILLEDMYYDPETDSFRLGAIFDYYQMQNLVEAGSGDFTVQALDRNGCDVTVDLNLKIRESEYMSRLRVVTVENGKNKLIWEPNLEMKEYNVYGEDTQGRLGLRATIGADEPGEWVDQESDPRIRSYRYYIRSVDSCDMESDYIVHKTMHLTINRGISNCWNLIWSKYEGNLGPVYYIYRGTSPDNLELIAEMPAGDNTSYSDYDAPDGDVYYQVEFLAPPLFYSPHPTKDVIRCFSNIATNGQIGIDDIEQQPVNIHAANRCIHVSCNENTTTSIFDITGRCVATLKGSASTTPLHPGVYMVKVGNSPLQKIVVME